MDAVETLLNKIKNNEGWYDYLLNNYNDFDKYQLARIAVEALYEIGHHYENKAMYETIAEEARDYLNY